LRRHLFALGAALTLASPACAERIAEMTDAAIAADRAAFRTCLAALWPEAQRRGIARALFDRELGSIEPDMRLVERMRAQSEFERPLWEYLAGAVSEARVRAGRDQLTRHAALLERIEREHGVDRFVLVALWALETNYGATLGEARIVRSTATLACIGRRKEFFRGEVLAALDILQRGYLASADLRGSWAGAFGHTQVMPSVFLRGAIDGDGDGRRDPVRSLADAFATTARLLAEAGWQRGRPWGYEVALPPNYDFRMAGRREWTLQEWQTAGVRRANGEAYGRLTDPAMLMTPGGPRGPAFLVLANFHALHRYNGSEAYAYSLGHLADRLRGGGPFVARWPADLRPMSRADRQDLQSRLVAMGWDVGGVTGMIGWRTREAVRAFQLRQGLTPHGFVDHDVLQRLRTTAPGN